MNDLITSSTQSTSLAPNLNSNHQSLFKLPFIFTMLMIFNNLFIQIFFVQRFWGFSYIGDSELYYLSASMASLILESSLLYFMIATIIFAAQRMHQITMTNLIIIVMSCIIYQLFNYVSGMNFDNIYFIFPSKVIDSWGIVLVTVKPIILVVIITLVSQFGKAKRTPYYFPLGNNRTVLATLFSFIFLLPSVAIYLLILREQYLDYLHYLGYLGYWRSSENIILSGIFPSVLNFIFIATNFLIIFFSVKNCFVREIDTIPLKSLCKAVGWSYLYLLGFGICISFVYSSIVTLLPFYMPRHDQRYALMILLMLSSLIIIVINLIGVIKLLRKAVRKYFS